MGSGCSILLLRERTTLTGAAGQKKRVVRCAGFLRDPWPRPIRKSRTATNGRTIEDRKGMCGTASITAPPGRPDRRRAWNPEMTGHTPAVRAPTDRLQTIHVLTARIRTGRIQSVLPLTVRAPTDHILTVPGRKVRDLTAHQPQVGGRDVRVRTIGSFSLLRAALLTVEALAVQRNRIASLSAATLPTSSR